MHYEHSMVHRAPGFTDAEAKQYREYDQSGRNQQTFHQRAALAGIKNLQSTSYRHDGPIGAVVDRFPEKFSSSNAANHNPSGHDMNTNSMSKISSFSGTRSHTRNLKLREAGTSSQEIVDNKNPPPQHLR